MTSDSYLPLPDSEASTPLISSHSWALSNWKQTRAKLRPRRLVVVVVILVYLVSVALFYAWKGWAPLVHREEFPWSSDAQNFDSIFTREAELPQHNPLAPYPEGKNGRYLRFSNEMRGAGWNNILQERLLNTILAYESDRAPVFMPFEASAHPPRNDTADDGHREVLMIPCNALISGPTSGMSWGPKDRHPRAISQHYWDDICPEPERRVINANEIMKQLGKEPDGLKILNQWTKLIRSMSESCVEIKGTQIFHVNLISLSGVLPLWDTFKNHPTVRLLDDSEVVKNAVSHNIGRFQTVSWSQRLFPAKPDAIQGLLGIHIRRGDFRGDEGKDNGHCYNLGRWSYSFSGWNQVPELPDKYVQLPRDGIELGEYTPEIRDYYVEHCLPTVDQVASRIRKIRKETRTDLTHIFIANNAEDEYLTALRRALLSDGWAPNKITTSKDLELNWQATSVSNAVDMSILSRAEVFIGNGWSSMTSNVVMRRLTTGRSPESTRFW